VNNKLTLLFFCCRHWNSFVVGQTSFKCGPVKGFTRMKGE